MELLLKALNSGVLQPKHMPYKDPNDPRKLAYQKAWYKANAEHVNARAVEWREQNPEKAEAARKLLYEKNKEQELLKSANRYKKNRDRILARKKVYKAANKYLVNASAAKRRAAQRSPNWLTDFDKLKIKCLYSVASMLSKSNNEPWHVDHIIPLQGKNVCGLHVPSNLWFIKGSENMSKSNKFDFESN